MSKTMNHQQRLDYTRAGLKAYDSLETKRTSDVAWIAFKLGCREADAERLVKIVRAEQAAESLAKGEPEPEPEPKTLAESEARYATSAATLGDSLNKLGAEIDELPEPARPAGEFNDPVVAWTSKDGAYRIVAVPSFHTTPPSWQLVAEDRFLDSMNEPAYRRVDDWKEEVAIFSLAVADLNRVIKINPAHLRMY